MSTSADVLDEVEDPATGERFVAMKSEDRVCARCQTEYVVVMSPTRGRWVPERCPSCFPGSDAKAATIPRGIQNAEAVDRGGDILDQLAAAGVNMHEFRDATLDVFDWSEEDDRVLEAVHRYIEHIEQTRARKYARREWMYLYGDGSGVDGRGQTVIGRTGNGKTHLAIAIVRDLIERGILDARRFRFVSAEMLLLQCEATFKDRSTDSEASLIRHYAAFDALIIDDFGLRADMSAHALRVFTELLNARLGRMTLFASNLSIATLAKLNPGASRLTSRFAGACGEESCYVLPFRGHDRRLARSLRRSA